MTNIHVLEEAVVKEMKDMEKKFDIESSFGQRIADKIASFGGSWAFIGWMLGFLFLWITFNTLTLFHFIAFDPFPFILLNLCLSFLAGFQAPVILMAQNRSSDKDRHYAEMMFKNIYVIYLEMKDLNERIEKFDKLFVEVDEIDESIKRKKIKK